MLSRFSKKIFRFMRDDDGPTAVEYAILLGLIVLAIAASVSYVGIGVRTAHETIGTAINEAVNE
jgi:pilus assembly protein Flp/PilA